LCSSFDPFWSEKHFMLPWLSVLSIHIPTYFLVISAICTLGVFLLPWWAEKNGASENTASKLFLVILVTGIFGARLFHVIFEDWELYVSHPISILFLWEGGFVFFGGALAAGVASWFWLKKSGEDFYYWADLFAPWMALGYGLGRVGCFFNGCCYGTECHLPWAVKFPSHMNVIFPFVPRHPTQLYAFGLEVVFALILFAWSLRRNSRLEPFKNTGLLFCVWIFGHGIFRLIMEHFRDDERGGLYWGWSLSSLIAFALIGVGFWGFWARLQKSKKH